MPVCERVRRVALLSLIFLLVYCPGCAPPPPPQEPEIRELSETELDKLRLDGTAERREGNCVVYNGNRDLLVREVVFKVKIYENYPSEGESIKLPGFSGLSPYSTRHVDTRPKSSNRPNPNSKGPFEAREYLGLASPLLTPLSQAEVYVNPTGGVWYEYEIASAKGWNTKIYEAYEREAREWQINYGPGKR